jgi:hypothetical protein
MEEKSGRHDERYSRMSLMPSIFFGSWLHTTVYLKASSPLLNHRTQLNLAIYSSGYGGHFSRRMGSNPLVLREIWTTTSIRGDMIGVLIAEIKGPKS